MSNSKNAAPLEAFGLLVRGTRLSRGLTQQRAANGAGVSRKQWALLEQGQNVSAVFIQKVARYLELSQVPLGGPLRAVVGGAGIDIASLIHLADEFENLASVFAEQIRTIAYEAAMPQAGRGENAEAVAGFVAGTKRQLAEAPDRLRRAIEQLTADSVPATSAPVGAVKRTAKMRRRG